MGSSIAWLDTSADEQRKVRELIKLFSQPESRDELGVRSITNALSNLLFPGISTIQTRARYFLLVPWAFQTAAASPAVRNGRISLDRQARLIERQLIPVLQRTEGGSDESNGVIGGRAGAQVQRLPSSIYWAGLERLGVLARPMAPSQLLGKSANPIADVDELSARSNSEWQITLPPPPPGFPNAVTSYPGASGLDLTQTEASWLQERFAENAPESLLTYLVLADRPPDGDAESLWLDSLCLSAPRSLLRIIYHARDFAWAMLGASLVYNYLVALKYEASGFTRITNRADYFAEKYAEWLKTHASHLKDWNLPDLWNLLEETKNTIPLRTIAFVTNWVELIKNGQADLAIAEPDGAAGNLIANREKQIKGKQSRITNEKLLAMWGGSSGAGVFAYRWRQAKTMATDIYRGLHRAPHPGDV